MSETEKIVREELSKIIGKDTDEISINDDLVDHVGLDSLSILEIFGTIEEKFNVVLEPDKISKMKTIEDIVNLIEKK